MGLILSTSGLIRPTNKLYTLPRRDWPSPGVRRLKTRQTVCAHTTIKPLVCRANEARLPVISTPEFASLCFLYGHAYGRRCHKRKWSTTLWGTWLQAGRQEIKSSTEPLRTPGLISIASTITVAPHFACFDQWSQFPRKKSRRRRKKKEVVKWCLQLIYRTGQAHDIVIETVGLNGRGIRDK